LTKQQQVSHYQQNAFASCLFTYNCISQLCENKQKLYTPYWTSWHSSIFCYKLRTD